MPSRLIAVLILVGLAGMGLFRLRRGIRRLRDQEAFAERFLTKLSDYAQSGGVDRAAYGELTAMSVKMQHLVGSLGIFAAFKPPYANYQYSNYPIVLNHLPELDRLARDEWLGNIAREYHAQLRDTIVRFLGSNKDHEELASLRARNPLTWIGEGVAVVLSGPLLLLTSFGLMRGTRFHRLTSSKPFGVFSGLAGLVTFLAGLVTIVAGYDRTIEVISSFIQRVLR